MVLYVDLNFQRFVSAPGFSTSPGAIRTKRGDSGEVSIQFCRGTDLVGLADSSDLIYQAKVSGKYDGDPVIECASFADSVSDGPHVGSLTYDVAALDAAFVIDGDEDNDVAELAVMYEVTWREPGKGWLSTDTLAGVVDNDVVRSDQGLIPTIPGDVPGVAAVRRIAFDDAASVDVTAGTFTVGTFTVNFWDGSTGSAPAEPYLSYSGGSTDWETWILALVELVNNGATTQPDFTLVGTLSASDQVTADSDSFGGSVYLDLTAVEVGTQGNSIAWSFAATPSSEDDSGTLAGGVDARNFASDDFVSTLASQGLTSSQQAAAIENLLFQDAFTVVGDLESAEINKGLILTSPDGSRWRVTVDNAGALSTTSI